MGWRQKITGQTGQNNTPQRNPDRVFGFRLLAIGYIGYAVYKVFDSYFSGAEEDPKVWWLIAAGLLAVGDIAFAISSYISWKKEKAELEAKQLEEPSTEENETEE